MTTRIHKLPISAIRSFIRLESSSGIILLSAAILSFLINNSPFSTFYNTLLQTPINIHLSTFHFAKPILFWINEGLMALFFLLAGLEIKCELWGGELDSFRKIALPGSAALGGMLMPALIYVLFNWYDGVGLRGWAIPTATDIAFSLGILTLCGRRVPLALKVFLTALAIFDDLGAIIIIAIFYTATIYWLAMLMSLLCLGVLFALNRLGIKQLWPYLLVGVLLWLSILGSGIHATLAGVALAFTIPLEGDGVKIIRSPVRRLEHLLHPWVAFGVLPLFGLANAGVSFANVRWGDWLNPITLGVIVGLFVGKQIGVLGASWLIIKSGYATLPNNTNWRGIYGVALICGIGFTMSLFIGGLAFSGFDGNHEKLVRMGVLVGSMLSGLTGYFVLRWRTIK
ncbi:MAG: Na+/H+ antiporter NhaA [Gammaproteobacteria bacterium]